MDLLVRAWVGADSLPAAERVARRAVRIWGNATAFILLAEVLDYQGRFDEAAAAIDSVATRARESAVLPWARHWLRSGEFNRLDTLLAQQITTSGPQSNLLFWSAMSLRNQRRFDAALAMARRFRAAASEPGDTPKSAALSASMEAQVLLEGGKPSAAAALFDSIAAWGLKEQPADSRMAIRVWNLTQAATALAAAGDRAALIALADSVAVLGERAYTERDRRLHHHVRGLEAMARDDVAAAVDHFQRAMYSPTIGYNRTNYELAKAYLRQNKPREAINVLRPSARGIVLEAANFHLTLADVHGLLAQAFAAAGESDSARVHNAWGRR